MPHVTGMPSFRNVIGIEHTANAQCVCCFWPVLPFRERNNFTRFSLKHVVMLYL